MPAPFPKACTSCAKSKKRCNLGSPCSRCQLRSLDCHYQQTPEGPSSVANGSSITDGMQWQEGVNDLLVHDFDQDWPALMTNIEAFMVPDQVWHNDQEPISVLAGEVYQERMVYAVKQMQSLPSMFVTRGQTPFIHNALYRENLPQAIQDALAVSALYGAKNEANKTMVYMTIREKVGHLIESQNESAFEQLASLQALVLYQAIRYFDGDIRLRADAERTEALFISWAKQMRLKTKPAESGEFELVIDPWFNWVFAESQRRTVMVCFLLKGLYCFLKNGYDDAIPDLRDLSFFAQTALWNASSEFSWQKVISQKRMLPVTSVHWDGDMADADPSDLDELGILIMVLMKGVDHCSQWVGEQNLERYGLDFQSKKVL